MLKLTKLEEEIEWWVEKHKDYKTSQKEALLIKIEE